MTILLPFGEIQRCFSFWGVVNWGDSLGCYDKIPQSGGLINHRGIYLSSAVWGSERAWGASAAGFWGGALSTVLTVASLGTGARELLGSLF